MRVGSLFAGIGGFDLAAQRAGMEVVWHSEIDTHASRVLAHHWRHVANKGDIHDVQDPPGVDVLTGGFPCQDYSVAGRGAGLAGDRGALWWEYHRLITRLRPTWIVGENVPGLLSSRDGADFETIIGSLTECGYGVAWAVLDAQYFGVAQRRRRVFIVGHSGGEPRPEILALSEGLYGHPEPRRETGQGVAALTASGLGGGGPDDNLAQAGHLVAPPLIAGHARGEHAGQEGQLVVGFVARQDDAAPRYEQAPTFDTGLPVGAVAFAQNQRDELRELEVASSVSAERWGNATNQTLLAEIQTRGRGDATVDEIDESGVAQALRAGDGGSSRSKKIVTTTSVRRLTPVECERLQGFPGGWTDIAGNSDTQRYRQLGNAVAVPVAEWIMRRIRSSGP